MKPKTKLDFRVTGLMSSLPELSLTQKEWAQKTCFESYGAKLNKNVYCLDCGHQWKMDSQDWQLQIVKPVCPKCDKELQMFTHNGNCYKSSLFSIFDYVEEFQVHRIFEMNKHMKKKQAANYSVVEVAQHWVGTNGKKKTLSMTSNGSYYGSGFNYASGLEVRSSSGTSWASYSMRPVVDDINTKYDYPKKRIHPVLKRNGFKGGFYGIIPHELFSHLFANNFSETLFKLKQFAFLKLYINKIRSTKDHQEHLMTAMKTCIKNNYIVKEVGIWEDLIILQVHFNRDLKNPKYVCPPDLHKEHDRLVEKKRNIQRKKDYALLKTQMIANNKVYKREKKKFFGLCFESGHLKIEVLPNVEAFLEEEYAHRHCVFQNKYFLKPNSLVFCATYKGIRQETVEVTLNRLSLYQSRGLKNKYTIHHKNIIELVNSNLHKINEIINPKKEKNVKRKIVTKHQQLSQAV